MSADDHAGDILVPDVSMLERLDLAALFGNDNPVELDVGCGTGSFLIARAESHPEINMLGIERLLGRIRTVARKADRRGLANVRLLRVEAGHALALMLPEGSIRTVHVAFPDPWPKRRHHRRRLLQAETLSRLHRVLEPGGALYFSTDHQDYFESVMTCIAHSASWQAVPPFIPAPEERSSFERLWMDQGRTIFRCGFKTVPAQPLVSGYST